jgi:peptidoglycan-N-acetylglucosamine deacetylase
MSRRRVSNCGYVLAFLVTYASMHPVGNIATAGPRSDDAQRQCWSQDALSALPGENLITKAPGSRAPALTSSVSPILPQDAQGGSSTQQAPSVLTPVAAAAIKGAVRRVELPRGQKLIALTFDFCEQPGEIAGYEGAIVDYLRQNKIKATLFVGGKWMATHLARTEQLLSDPLFEMASHGLAHRNTRRLSGYDLRREIGGPSFIYSSARSRFASAQCAAPFKQTIASIPPSLRLFRFPFGACHPEGLAAVSEQGMTAIQWDVSTGDPSPSQSAAAIANVMVSRTRPGSIIIAHANGRGHNTAAALPLAIPKLKAMGYTFVTVSELISAGKPVIAETCFDSQPGDTDKYDTLFTKPVAPQTLPLGATPNGQGPKPSVPR